MRSRRALLSAWDRVCTVATRLESEIMPVRCVFCGVDTRSVAVCPPCLEDLPRIRDACPLCARPSATVCADCQQRPGPFTTAIAALEYRFPVDAAIRLYKFRRRLYYAPAFGHLLCEAATRLPGDVDALLPVPLHWRRHAYRGFNQVTEMCGPLRRATGLPQLDNVRRIVHTPYQSGLSAKQRRRNLRRAFTIRGTLDTRHVVVVDDVITTGETTRQLARVLLAAGADKVSVLALARA